jgi:hypothetical protein
MKRDEYQMQLKKVAIIKKGKDVGRIIPFNVNSGNYDFKISLTKNDYEIDMYTFLAEAPKTIKLDDMSSWEISYHRSTALKPTVIHLKQKKSNPEYKPLSIYRLKDPSIYTEFPIPLMKLEIPLNFTAKDYKQKPKEHIVFDIKYANVAEFYLAHISFSYQQFMKKWPALSLNLLIHSFEFFATNNLLIDEYKYKYFMTRNTGERVAIKEFIVNKDMKFYVNLYKNPEFNKGTIRVTFIENEFSDALLGLSLIGYENGQGKIKILPAYKEDLRRNTMTLKEKQKWEYRFNKIKAKLDREMRKKYGVS